MKLLPPHTIYDRNKGDLLLFHFENGSLLSGFYAGSIENPAQKAKDKVPGQEERLALIDNLDNRGRIGLSGHLRRCYLLVRSEMAFLQKFIPL